MATRWIERWAVEAGALQPLPAPWQGEVRAGRLKYVRLFESGFSRAMDNLTSPGVAKARLWVEPGLDQNVLTSHRMPLFAMAAQLRVEGLREKLPTPPDAAGLAGEVPGGGERVSEGPRPTLVQQNVLASLVFGMFFVVASSAGLFVEERACGPSSSLRSLGARPC